MLVLTRKPNQQLHIGNDIVITVVKVRGNTIRLGIEAPKDVRVIRSELEPKPAAGNSALGQCDVGRPDSQVDDADDSQPAAASDDAPQAADRQAMELQADDLQILIDQPVILQARVRQTPASASPLQRFAPAKRLQANRAERNLEDCPLCHRAGSDSGASPQRPGALHSYIAAKYSTPKGGAPKSNSPKNIASKSGGSKTQGVLPLQSAPGDAQGVQSQTIRTLTSQA